MATTTIIDEWKKSHFKPIYWLEGPEDFFIDEIIHFAETEILSPEEASFNLTIFYGKDADWTAVLNTCRAFPMMGQKQVVLIKEAQQMTDISKLESYMISPNEQTILVVGFKGKTLDKRTKMSKAIKEKGVLFLSKKLYDSQLPEWTNNYIKSLGLSIQPKALNLLVSHVGNDISRISNEIHKLSINVKDGKDITVEDIEQFIGISKDYNVFELIDALSYKNLSKAVSVIQYMKSNPKTIPIQVVFPSLYGFFTKLMMLYQAKGDNDQMYRSLFYNNPVAIKEAREALKKYTFLEMENAILLIYQYNLKSLGIGSYNTNEDALVMELVVKIMG